MGLFISYSSQDRSLIEGLTAALRRARQQVWFDEELGGGESWWSMILEQIRSSEVFIVALSNNWLESKPCQAELRYAQALHRPILPVRIGGVDSVRVNPLAALQIVEYQNPTVDTSIQLISAVHALRAEPKPLPSPLPDEPPVPFAYLMRLSSTLTENELSPQQQTILLAELKSGFEQDGDDPSARRDIAQLLRMLRNRHDVTWRTRSEIDEVLDSIDESRSSAPNAEPAAPQRKQPISGVDQPPQPRPSPAATASPQPRPPMKADDGSATPPQPGTGPQQRSTGPQSQRVSSAQDSGAGTDRRSRKRWMIVGGAALAAVAAIVLVVVLVTQGPSHKPSSKPSGATTAAVSPGRMDSILLGTADIGTILGDPNMVSAAQSEHLRPQQGTLSNPDCLGAFEPLQEPVYRASGFTAVRSEVLHTAGEHPAHRVVEAAASFSSADEARAFVDASAEKWRACAGQTVKFTNSGATFEWSIGDLTGAAPKITQVHTQTDGSGRACQHVLSAVSDVVIDVQACGPDITDAAGRMAEQMGATSR